MNTVEPIRNKKTLNKIKEILSENQRDFLIFTVGTNCGLRISDILSLNVKDVKDKSYIDITEKKTKKTKKIPVSETLKSLIEDFIKNRNENEPLFLSYLNNRMERTQCYRIINKACKKAGVNYKIGTHTLRKTFGYHHYKKFKDVAILQKIFNHSAPGITLRYIGIDQDTIDKSYKNFML